MRPNFFSSIKSMAALPKFLATIWSRVSGRASAHQEGKLQKYSLLASDAFQIIGGHTPDATQTLMPIGINADLFTLDDLTAFLAGAFR